MHNERGYWDVLFRIHEHNLPLLRGLNMENAVTPTCRSKASLRSQSPPRDDPHGLPSLPADTAPRNLIAVLVVLSAVNAGNSRSGTTSEK